MVETLDHEAYNVKMDGSGRVLKRHRRFLRPIVSYSDVVAGKGITRGTPEVVRPQGQDNANKYTPTS